MIVWSIENLERNPITGGVRIVYWKAEKVEAVEDTTYSAFLKDSIRLDPNPEDPSFIPYEDLEETDVINWIIPLLNVEKLESLLDAELSKKINPPLVRGTPW